MEFIAHRINTIEELKRTPTNCGVEIDLRDYNDKLIIQHDPFKDGEDFENYLKHYQHQTLILNIKSERIEFKVIEFIKKYHIKKYFFLDCSFPMVYALAKLGEHNMALRYSEFEGMDTIIQMSKNIKWVWVDCFTKLPLSVADYQKLKQLDLKLCLVSPELQNQPEKISSYKQYLQINNIYFDAICTKRTNIEKWVITKG